MEIEELAQTVEKVDRQILQHREEAMSHSQSSRTLDLDDLGESSGGTFQLQSARDTKLESAHKP